MVQGNLGTKPVANAEVHNAGRQTSVRSAAPGGVLNIVPLLLPGTCEYAWQSGFKVADGIKVANQVTLKIVKLSWTIWVGPT